MLIAEAYRRTEECLATHKDNLKLMAEALLAKETLNYDDVEKLLGPPPHGKKHLVSISPHFFTMTVLLSKTNLQI